MSRVYDIESREQLVQFKSHDCQITSICYLSDGKNLFSSGVDGKIFHYNLEEKVDRKIFSFEDYAKDTTDNNISVNGLISLCNGFNLCFSNKMSLYIFEYSEQKVVSVVNKRQSNITSVSFCKNYDLIGIGHKDGSILFYDYFNEEIFHLLLSEHKESVYLIEFCEINGEDYAFSVSGSDEAIMNLFNLNNNTTYKNIILEAAPKHICYCYDNLTVLLLFNEGYCLLKNIDNETQKECYSNGVSLNSGSYLGDGKNFIFANGEGTIELWSIGGK